MLIIAPESTCDICDDSLNADPRPSIIPCGHVFCQPCLSNRLLQPDNPEVYRCPTCLRPFNQNRKDNPEKQMRHLYVNQESTRDSLLVELILSSGWAVLGDSRIQPLDAKVEELIEGGDSEAKELLAAVQHIRHTRGSKPANSVDMTMPSSPPPLILSSLPPNPSTTSGTTPSRKHTPFGAHLLTVETVYPQTQGISHLQTIEEDSTMMLEATSGVLESHTSELDASLHKPRSLSNKSVQSWNARSSDASFIEDFGRLPGLGDAFIGEELDGIMTVESPTGLDMELS